MSNQNGLFKAKIVYLILSKKTQKALESLSDHYKKVIPKLKVGIPKRYSKNPACYVGKTQTIYVFHRKILWNPKLILHEFYHHLRRVSNNMGGVEKYANRFAKNFIDTYENQIG